LLHIHSYTINGLSIQTGDILCTVDGEEGIVAGEFWRLIGKLVPGAVDHLVIYVGPNGRCVEAAIKGAITFDIPDDTWDSKKLVAQRGPLYDTLYGVAYPLEKRKNLSDDDKCLIRLGVADYCLTQVAAKKQYNLNFFNSDTEDSFYCSQLAYKAYLKYGIDLNTGQGVPNLFGTSSIVFPQEIWEGCFHRRSK
jgi:hypothetical protein